MLTFAALPVDRTKITVNPDSEYTIIPCFMKLLSPSDWPDYQLIDSGAYEKLERFGKYILRRPEPQAVWRKSLPESDWQSLTNAWFRKEKGKPVAEGNERGEWIIRPGMSEQWFVSYAYREMKLRFRLGLTAFKHVGIFPEQAGNWNYIYDSVLALPLPQPKILNLFAYTGGASLAAKAAGADVTHVDSVRQVLSWSRENMEASGLDNIRWICEDALRFVKREVKREKRYQGIILDPPAYGRGPEGEKWVLEDNIAELMEAVAKITAENSSFCVLNLYSMGFSSLIAGNLIRDYFPQYSQMEFGELFLPDQAQRKLPLSVYARAGMGKT
jgi:23S rRNA (cytosine1962-C5)-methyltransferase